MVLGEDETFAIRASEAGSYLARQMQLRVPPQPQRPAAQPEPLRRVRQIGLDQPLELQKRLVVEPDVVDLLRRQAGAFETELDRADRERIVVLLARETLFLRGRDDASVHDERGCRVVIE